MFVVCRRLFCRLCLLGLIFGPATPLFGEESKPSDLGDVLVQGSPDQESREKPSAFASVIYPDDYRDELTTLPELLSRQVGLFVKSFGGMGQLSTVSIRGSSAQQVSVYIDGIKINTAQGGAVDFSTIPLGGIERVEVIRGGASSQFGSDAIGGVINIVTKKAQKKASYEFRFSEGSFFTIETHGGFSKRFGKLGLTLDHTHLSSDGDFSFIGTGVQFAGGGQIGGDQEFTRLHNSFWSEGFVSRLDYELDPKRRISFTNDFYYTSREVPGTELETTQLFPSNPLDAHENLFEDAAGLSFSWDDVGVPGFGFSIQPNYHVEHSHFTDPTPALGGPIDVSFLNQGVGIKPEWTYGRGFPGHRHDLSLFYDFRYERFNDASPIPGTPLSGLHTRFTNALFFQDEITILGERLYFNPSIRWEHASDFGGNVAGHFGIVGRPADWVTLKSNVENSFRYPSFDELFFPDQGFLRGNPDLEEETAFNFDIGAAFQQEKFRIELSYFRNQIYNSIGFVPISAFTIAPVNTGPATAQGLEASFACYPARFVEITGNYTFLNAVLDANGNQLPGRARHLANARVEFNWKYATLFSQVQYIDRLPIDFANTKFLNQRALVDVGGTFKWKNRYFVTVQGKNVGNVQAFDAVGFPLPRAQVYFSFGIKT